MMMKLKEKQKRITWNLPMQNVSGDASDLADNDAWKDKGTGQLAIKCKEGVNKGTKESKPTILSDMGNNNIDSDGVVACTFLIRTKTEEDRNKLAAAIQGGLVEVDESSFSFGGRASSKNLPSGANIQKLTIFSYVQEANAPVSCREERMFSSKRYIQQQV
ncbi:unnamed protein product [Camellia sinensis]